LPIFWVEVNGCLVSFDCRFPLAEFSIRDSEIEERVGKIGVQSSGFTVLLNCVNESALRCERDPLFMMFSGRTARPGSFVHDDRDSIVLPRLIVDNRQFHSQPDQQPDFGHVTG
jgi:hypothetical protein